MPSYCVLRFLLSQFAYSNVYIIALFCFWLTSSVKLGTCSLCQSCVFKLVVQLQTDDGGVCNGRLGCCYEHIVLLQKFELEIDL